jgi:hypothetical protein
MLSPRSSTASRIAHAQLIARAGPSKVASAPSPVNFTTAPRAPATCRSTTRLCAARAITPMALYETVMVRAYETLVDPGTTVDVNTGMVAAGRLQAMVESRAGETSLAEIVVKMNRVIEAVRSTVPESMWPEIRRRLEGDDEPAEPLEEEDWDGFEPDDDPFDSDDSDGFD